MSMLRKKVQRGLSASPSISALVLVALLIVAVAVMAVGCGDSGSGSAAGDASGNTTVASRDTISVDGHSTVDTAPDQAVITLTVENQAGNSTQAMNDNSQKTSKVAARLRSEGVKDTEMQTSSVNLYPIRTYDQQTGAEKLTGYRAQNTITVTLKDVAVVGRVLGAGVDAGATSVSGPVWSLSDDSQALSEALKKAVANAKAKAEALASASDVKLGKVLMISETTVGVDTSPSASQATDVAMAGKSDVPVSSGTIEVTATIVVTYELKR